MHLSDFSLSLWGQLLPCAQSEQLITFLSTHSVSQKVKVVVHIAVGTCLVILQKCTAVHLAFRSKEKQCR